MKRFRSHLTLPAILFAAVICMASSCAIVTETPTAVLESNGSPPSYPQSQPEVEPVINSFTVTPTTISSGQSVTLNWSVSDALTVNIQPLVGNVDSNGSRQTTPTSSSIFTLTATNEAGSSTRTVSLTVEANDDTLIGSDPVSGRNESIDFTWEQLCLADEYQIQIAKNRGFSQVVFDSGPYATALSTSPALPFPSGLLEAGHTYYWRVRVRRAATGQVILSSWSQTRSFTVSSGLPAATQYFGAQSLSPNNNCTNCPVEPAAFSWSPFNETTKYKFILAKDSALTDVMVEAEVTTTSYEYEGILEYSTSYYWKVMALEPAPSDWSATFNLQTEAAPPPPPMPEPPPTTPLWAWVVIGIGSIFVIIALILAFAIHRS